MSRKCIGRNRGLTTSQYFIRQNTASTIARRMQYLNEPLKRTTQYVVDELRAADGDGGVIAIDDAGNGEYSFPHVSERIIDTVCSVYDSQLPRHVPRRDL